MQLSPNFSLHELTKSYEATRKGLDNTPPPEAVARLRVLAERVLQPVRDHFGPTTINSGYRSLRVNTAIRGAKKSQHMLGEAADLEVHGVANADLAAWIRDNLDFDQLILELYTPGQPNSGWVHVSYAGMANRKQVLTYLEENGKNVYKNGLIA